MVRNAEIALLEAEVNALSDTIFRTLLEVTMLRHPMMDDDRVLAAVDELDAIVAATEVATDDILTVTEALDDLGARLAAGAIDAAAAAAGITTATTAIYQAANFQDVTGQRIAKVVGLLRDVDDRVRAILEHLGGNVDVAHLPPPPRAEGDAALLGGPQSEAEALVQGDIDRMFG